MVYVFMKNKHDQSNRIFKNMAWDGIWNDLELQRKMKTMSLKNAFWHYLKRFKTEDFL